MKDKDNVLYKIREVFNGNEYPGDTFLRGSAEGCEPYDEVEPFKGRMVWQRIEPSFLDAHASALSFFSEAGFRFFLPAYLVADVQGELKSADPVTPLTHGFSEAEVRVTVNGRDFILRTGRSELLNPGRYGAATFYDFAHYRLSIFTREEAQAIVSYLEYKQDVDPTSPDRMRIEAALDSYWRERARNAPAAERLRRHIIERDEFVAATSAAKRNP